jgi:predicted metal-dependent phosphoesterase TrpH
VHLLAYAFDDAEPALAAQLERIRSDRIPRLQRMTERLRAAGSAVTWDDVVGESSTADALGRPHLADALVRIGEAASRTEAFDRVVGTHSHAYVAKHAPATADAIRLVRDAGGVSVIAHPWSRGRRRSLPVETLRAFADVGLTGLEVDHPDHPQAIRDELFGIAIDLGLIITGSSDYHGTGKVDHELGTCLTGPDAYEALFAGVEIRA